jgi:general secretion pathway protein J
MRARRRGGAAGFTLLELLVAVTLMSLIALILSGGLTFGVRAWRRAQARSDEAALMLAVHDALARLIGGAQAAYASGDPADLRLSFAGDTDRLRLTAPLPEAIEPGLWATQTLSVQAGEHGSALVLAWRLDLPDAAEQPRWQSPLVENVRFVRMQYWGVARPGDAPGWQGNWLGRAELPGLVQIEIGREGAADWRFTFAVAPFVSPVCHYDPIGPACRRG